MESLDGIKADIEQLDLIEELQERLNALEKKHQELKMSLWAAFGVMMGLLFMFRS
jgi:hypothetical protein